jgi:hypothetical protein
MTTFVWTVNSLSTLPVVDGQTDVVVTAMYTVTATEAAVVVATHNMQRFTYTGSAFTPFNQLTEDQVIGWIQAELTPVGVDNLLFSLVGQINSIVTPPVIPLPQPLPWVA